MKWSACLPLLFALASCATAPPSGTPGMVYDEEGRPLAGVDVLAAGELLARSDVNGRFLLGALPAGQTTLDYRREGYESGSLRLGAPTEAWPGSVLYLKLASRDQLLKRVWDALDRAQYAEARDLLDRAGKVGPSDGFWALTQAALLLLDPDSPPGALEAFLPDVLRGRYGPLEPGWKAWWENRLGTSLGSP